MFGQSNSNSSDNKIDTSLFVRKPYLRTNCMEIIIEEDIDLENQFRIKNILDRISIGEAASKIYVDNKFNDPSIIKNTAHVDFNDKNLDNVRFVKINSTPAVQEHFTPKYYVNQKIFYHVGELFLSRLDPNEELKLDEQDSIILNSTLTSPKTIKELPTESHVDSLHESSRSR